MDDIEYNEEIYVPESNTEPVLSPQDPEAMAGLPEAEWESPKPETKSGRLWPPLLILGILFSVGLVLFFLLGNSTGAVSDPATPWFQVQSGVLYFDESRYTGSSELTVPSVIAGQSVTIISDGCFAGTSLTTVTLPQGITKIGNGAFSGCDRLRGLLLPEALQCIGADAFSGCTALEAIAIPYSAAQIGEGCFTGCGKLSYIFYTGPMAAWKDLGVDISDTKANIYCYDGIYPHG